MKDYELIGQMSIARTEPASEAHCQSLPIIHYPVAVVAIANPNQIVAIKLLNNQTANLHVLNKICIVQCM